MLFLYQEGLEKLQKCLKLNSNLKFVKFRTNLQLLLDLGAGVRAKVLLFLAPLDRLPFAPFPLLGGLLGEPLVAQFLEDVPSSVVIGLR